MAEFVTGLFEQIGTPISSVAKEIRPSRNDAVGIIVASLVSLQLYPKSNELTDIIRGKVEQFEEARAVDAQAGDPDVAVRYSIDLDSEVLTADSLLARYRAAGHKAVESWAPLWSQFTDTELNKRRIGETVAVPEAPFQGRVVGWLQGGDHPTEVGLYLTKKPRGEQQQAAKERIDGYERPRTGLYLPAFGDFVLAYAAEAEARDGVALDPDTFSRMVQHDMKSVGGRGLYGPCVHLYGGGLSAAGSSVLAGPGGGVRFLLGQTGI